MIYKEYLVYIEIFEAFDLVFSLIP